MRGVASGEGGHIGGPLCNLILMSLTNVTTFGKYEFQGISKFSYDDL